MAATKRKITEWLEKGKRRHATHVIIIYNTFNYDDYPIYVQSYENARQKIEQYRQKKIQQIRTKQNYKIFHDHFFFIF